MLLKVVNGNVSYRKKEVLEEVYFDLNEHDKVSIVGRNGCGKTTFLNALVHPFVFEEGIGEDCFSFFQSKNITVGYLEQNAIRDEEHTLKEELLSVFSFLLEMEEKMKLLEDDYSSYEKILSDYKLHGGYEYLGDIDKMMLRFGFFKEDENKKMKEFSGGQRTKIALMKLLLSKPNVLLLDEPTNHLDLDTILWLEEYLRDYPYAVVLVSHDRMFLDHVVNKVFEIEYGLMKKYVGNYSAYERQKEENYEKQWKDYTYQQKEIKRLQSIADRFRYKPTKAKMALSKLKKIEQMVLIEKPMERDDKKMKLQFPLKEESGDIVLTLKNLEIGYESALHTVTFTLHKKERLAILGPNGSGKSTLLKTIISRIPKRRGSFSFGYHVHFAYFDQQMNNLNLEHTVLEEMMEVMNGKSIEEVRSFLGRFLFTGEDVFKKISVLSGGEKVRISLAKILLTGPNLLILDEPTNHMDLIGKEVLEKCLESYEGTILFVSHDRYFIQKLADSILYLGEEPQYFRGKYSLFMEQRKNTLSIPASSISKKKEKPLLPNREKEKLRKKLEKEISTTEMKLKHIEEEMFLEDNYLDYQKMKDLAQQQQELNDLLEKKLFLLEEMDV